MVSANVCRALPPATDDFDPEKDKPVLELARSHLQVAYEFFLRFIISSEVNAKAAKKYADQKFVYSWWNSSIRKIHASETTSRQSSTAFAENPCPTDPLSAEPFRTSFTNSYTKRNATTVSENSSRFSVASSTDLPFIQYVKKDADTATPILNDSSSAGPGPPWEKGHVSQQTRRNPGIAWCRPAGPGLGHAVYKPGTLSRFGTLSGRQTGPLFVEQQAPGQFGLPFLIERTGHPAHYLLTPTRTQVDTGTQLSRDLSRTFSRCTWNTIWLVTASVAIAIVVVALIMVICLLPA
eukprot:CAMPEP_0168309884 /NCGR_PEP_ID=MMETSP0142_2-20121227/66523_1 /TAXON_ID=44445 /ORGANISM="Pseudo-nitzschia australis, Strain 10249 10 AB" /LENGTH=293 /DNA_ID=CAMNT_0008262649 /DNA_START=2141 /DNA_END=3023 /DNA_ORIENTATION=-